MGKTYKSTRTVKSYTKSNQALTLVNEPMLSNYANPNSLQSILNLTASFQNEMDLVNLTRNGILKQSVTKMAANFGITQEKICELLHMSTRNFQRIKDNTPLDIYTSEQTIEMANVYSKAHLIFVNDEAVKQWFQTSNYALGNQKPLDLLDTSFGVKMVSDVLGRIEHGVFS